MRTSSDGLHPSSFLFLNRVGFTCTGYLETFGSSVAPVTLAEACASHRRFDRQSGRPGRPASVASWVFEKRRVERRVWWNLFYHFFGHGTFGWKGATMQVQRSFLGGTDWRQGF